MKLFVDFPNAPQETRMTRAFEKLANRYPQEFEDLMANEEYQTLADFIVECHWKPEAKIPNIKLFRKLSGMSLTESKHMIDTAYVNHAEMKREREALSAAYHHLKDAPPEDDDLPF